MATLKPIRTEGEYNEALARIDEIWNAVAGSPEEDELEALTILVAAYEKSAHPIPPPHPIDAIRFAMEQHGLKPKDLEAIIGPSGRVSEVLNRKRQLTLTMIRKLCQRLGLDAGVLIPSYELELYEVGKRVTVRKAGRKVDPKTGKRSVSKPKASEFSLLHAKLKMKKSAVGGGTSLSKREGGAASKPLTGSKRNKKRSSSVSARKN